MAVTVFIRYQLDPFKRGMFEEYSKRWLTIIPKCGGDLIGYFMPHEGTNNIAFALISFPSLAAYEAYRARLRQDKDGAENFQFAEKERFILAEERTFLRDSSVGIGSLALTSLLHADYVNPLAPKKPPLPAKAERVIYLHLSGAPPHLDLWDYKPELVKRTGQNCPDEYTKGKRFAFTSGTPKLLGTPRTFKKFGKGVKVRAFFDHFVATVSDRLIAPASRRYLPRPRGV